MFIAMCKAIEDNQISGNNNLDILTNFPGVILIFTLKDQPLSPYWNQHLYQHKFFHMSFYMWMIPYTLLSTAFVWCANTPTNLPMTLIAKYLPMSCSMFYHPVPQPMDPQSIPTILFHHGLVKTYQFVSQCTGSTQEVTRSKLERQND